MADVIKEQDVERLVSRAKQYADSHQYSPVNIIKMVMDAERCTLGEAKEAYTLAVHEESLGAYQGRIILSQIEELE